MDEGLSSLPLERRWQQQRHPMPSVLAVVRAGTPESARYLMIKRIKEPYTGKWALVGGKWDFGESLAEAVCREIYEETGLRTGFTSLRGVINERMHPKSQTDGGGHFLLFVCELHVLEGEASEQAEGKVAWFSTSELQDLHMEQAVVPTDYKILEHCHMSCHPLQYLEAVVVAGQNTLATDRFDVIG